MLDPEVEQSWIQVDSCGLLWDDPFYGTREQLQAHLTRSVRGFTPDFGSSREEWVWIHDLSAAVHSYVVVMKLPWGTYQWMQQPPARLARRRWLAWLLDPV